MNALPTVSEARRPLRFELTVLPAEQRGFGVELVETSESNAERPLRVRLDGKATARVINSLLAAIRQSKLKPSALSSERKRPIELAEPAGVRLALVTLATAPLTRRVRISEIEEGVAAMSTEETYYWYSKCTGSDAKRSQRALRLLLSDD